MSESDKQLAAEQAKNSMKGAKEVLPVIATLSEYKEIIALLLFLSAGFVWIYGVFATQKQLNKLQCVTNVNIELTVKALHENLLSKELIDAVKAESALIQRQKDKFTIDKGNLDDARDRVKRLGEEVEEVKTAMSRLVDQLKSGGCKGG